MSRDRVSRSLAVAALLFVAQCARGPSVPGPTHPLAVVSAGGGVSVEVVTADPSPVAPELDWAKSLAPLKVECANTGAKASVRLYDNDGSLDAGGVDTFSRTAADTNGMFPLTPRLVQLAVKAAHHFDVTALVVVSGFRKSRPKTAPDHHARGEALDFRLPGVDYRKLAAYLRSLPRVGVGVYTDARTQYVHLDVRDRSFHWLDASPPGVVWREAPLPDSKQSARDAAYSPEADLPLDAL